MHVDDQGRKLPVRCPEVGVDGRVVEAVRFLAVGGLPRQHLRRRDEGRGHFRLGGGTQNLCLAARDLDDRGRVRGGVREEHDATVGRCDVADRPPTGCPLLGHSVVDAHGADMPLLVLGPGADEKVVVVVVVGVQAQLPVGVRESPASRMQGAGA